MNKEDAEIMLDDMTRLGFKDFYMKYEPENVSILSNKKEERQYRASRIKLILLRRLGKRDLLVGIIKDDPKFKHYKVLK